MTDTEPKLETAAGHQSPVASPTLNLKTAIEMGEFDPEYLATFAEWHTLSVYMQYEFVRKGIENRRRHLRQQYAAMYNAPNLSEKPHLKEALDNIHNQLRKLQTSEEDMALRFTKLM